MRLKSVLGVAWLAALVVLVLTSEATPLQAFPIQYIVKGTIHTSTEGTATAKNQPVAFVKVSVMDMKDPQDPDELITGYTNEKGEFSVLFPYEGAAPKIQIDVLAQVNVEPDKKTDPKYFIKLHEGPEEKSPIKQYKNLIGDKPYDVSFKINDVGTLNLPDNRCNILIQARKAIRYALDHQATDSKTPQWKLDHDLDAYPDYAGAVERCYGNSIYIRQVTYEDAGKDEKGAFSNIHHETGHFIAFRAYGGRFPISFLDPIEGHSPNKETSPGVAIVEGWAEYFANESHSDWLSEPAVTDEFAWRGQDNMGDHNDVAFDESPGMGEIVEGAIAKTWTDIDNFEKVFAALVKGKPSHFQEWYKAWKDLYPEDASLALRAAQPNGIIYSRGKIDGFQEGSPPNEAPSDPKSGGNQKIIRGITFLRGTVTPRISQVQKEPLRLAADSSIIPCKKKQLGWKEVSIDEAGMTDQLKEAPFGEWSLGFEFLLDIVAWDKDILFDTKERKDGSYDLIVKVLNEDDWWDNFTPTFAGDSDKDRNSDEKWLKHLQTWYSRTTEPTKPITPDTKAEDIPNASKVIIDNTPPKIQDVFPAPN